MNPEWCSLCNRVVSPRKQGRTPSVKTEETDFGKRSVNVKNSEFAEYILVRTARALDPERRTFEQLDEETKFVHVDGHPFVWAIERILEKAPNLEIIRMIPTMCRKLTANHRTLCEKRNVRIVAGHQRPEMAWRDGENRSPLYDTQRRFFLELAGEQKILFDELLAMEFEAAQMTARYFCLQNEKYVGQLTVAVEYGYSAATQGHASSMISAVVLYLDPEFKANKDSVRIARNLKQNVERLRREYGELLEVGKIITRMNEEVVRLTGDPTSKVPSKLPIARFESYKVLVMAKMNGRLEWLQYHHPRHYEAVTLRFGIFDGTFKTLEVCGTIMNLTRERIRQLEDETLESHTFLKPS